MQSIEIINNNNNNNINAWIIKPPEKSNAVGVKAFKNPDVDLGEIYFQKENNNNNNKEGIYIYIFEIDAISIAGE